MSLALSRSTMRTRMGTMWRAMVGTMWLRMAEVVVLLYIGRMILRATIMLFMVLIILVAVTLLGYVLSLVIAAMVLWRRVRGLVPTIPLVALV